MIHEDKLKLNTALLEAKELKENDYDFLAQILKNVLAVAKSNSELDFDDDYAGLKTKLNSARASHEWELAKAHLIESIQKTVDKFCH